VKRLNLFVKGNVDVHDSLHSCRIRGEVCWNGINDVIRTRYPGTLVRLKHETCARSDAVLETTGAVPHEIEERQLPLGSYPAASQFSTALFESKVDGIVLSIQPDICIEMVRHRKAGYLFYPRDAESWPKPDRQWLKSAFYPVDPPDAATSMDNLEAIINKIRMHSDVPILVFNMSSIVPGEAVHCLQGLGETFSTRVRRFNLGLAELSEKTGISIIDVDTIIGRAGADRLKLDAIHLAPEGYRLIAEEVVRVLDDLGVLQMIPEPRCVPA
jgi:hypothetical protein